MAPCPVVLGAFLDIHADFLGVADTEVQPAASIDKLLATRPEADCGGVARRGRSLEPEAGCGRGWGGVWAGLGRGVGGAGAGCGRGWGGVRPRHGRGLCVAGELPKQAWSPAALVLGCLGRAGTWSPRAEPQRSCLSRVCGSWPCNWNLAQLRELSSQRRRSQTSGSYAALRWLEGHLAWAEHTPQHPPYFWQYSADPSPVPVLLNSWR
nr:uncharacterized protein LOC129038275 [Pongo pygmaeus]